MIRSTQRIQSEVELKNYKQWLIFFSELDSLWRMSIKNINLVSSINIYEIVVFRLNDFFVCAWLSLPTLESQLIVKAKSLRVWTFISITTSSWSKSQTNETIWTSWRICQTEKSESAWRSVEGSTLHKLTNTSSSQWMTSHSKKKTLSLLNSKWEIDSDSIESCSRLQTKSRTMRNVCSSMKQ